MEKKDVNPDQKIEDKTEIYISHKLSPDDIEKIEKYRQSRKTSVLTIMFTDIVGYTRFTYDAGEIVSGKFRYIHDDIIINQIKKSGYGEIIKQIGDSFLIVFSDPTLAVKQAMKLQELFGLNSENLTFNGYQLKIRIGLHMGQVSVEDHIMPDVFGTHVNLASRVMSLARGGQVLVSGSVWDNASGWLKDEQEVKVKSVYYGKIKLKGIGKAIEIYEFFMNNKGKIGIPKPILKRKQRLRMVWSAVILILLIIVAIPMFLLLRQQSATTTETSSNEREKILLIDIESNDEDIEYLKRLRKEESEILDSNWNLIESIDPQIIGGINEKYYEQLITSFIIDYDVKTEQEEKQKYAAKGLIFTHDIKKDTTLFDEYFVILIPHLYKFKQSDNYLLMTEIIGTSSKILIIRDIDSVPALIINFANEVINWEEHSGQTHYNINR
jgi:class 3 adenylate cyclase